jgi:hypothetical protein
VHTAFESEGLTYSSNRSKDARGLRSLRVRRAAAAVVIASASAAPRDVSSAFSTGRLKRAAVRIHGRSPSGSASPPCSGLSCFSQSGVPSGRRDDYCPARPTAAATCRARSSSVAWPWLALSSRSEPTTSDPSSPPPRTPFPIPPSPPTLARSTKLSYTAFWGDLARAIVVRARQ